MSVERSIERSKGSEALARLVDYWFDRRVADAVLALAAGSLGYLYLLPGVTWRPDVLNGLSLPARQGLYTDLITVSGIFVAFSATGLAAYLAMTSGGVERLRAVANKQVLAQWISTIAGTSATLLGFLLVKVFDRSEGATWTHHLAVALFVFLVARTCRLLYVFALISGIATKDFKRKTATRTPQVRK